MLIDEPGIRPGFRHILDSPQSKPGPARARVSVRTVSEVIRDALHTEYSRVFSCQ